MAKTRKKRFADETPEQYMLSEESLAKNPNCRTPVVICLDCSYSMCQNRRLENMKDGIRQFCEDMAKDPIAKDSLELCLVSFGGDTARIEQDFAAPKTILENGLPALKAEGKTPMADAVDAALEALERRKARYNDNGISHYRPWLIIISDGDQSGLGANELRVAQQRLATESEARRLNVTCIRVGDQRRTAHSSLEQLAPDGKVHYLKDIKFAEFFRWLSRSVERTSQSVSGEEVKYTDTATWESIAKEERRRQENAK